MSDKSRQANTALLRKSHDSLYKTIQPGVTLSALQKKALNALHYMLQSYVKHNFKSADVFHATFQDRIMDFEIRRSKFESLISYHSRNNVYLKDLLRQLSKIQADWTDNEGGDQESYSFTNIFLAAGLRHGYVTIKIPPQTRMALISDRIESTVDVIKISENLNGKYAIGLYDLIRPHFEREPEDVNVFTFKVDDDTLRNVLHVPYKFKDGEKKWSYPTISRLNEKVLKPGLAELAKRDFEFTATCKFDRKSCGTVYWIFTVTSTGTPSTSIIASEFANDFVEIKRALTKFGVKRISSVMADIKSKKDVMYFQFCIEAVEKASRKRDGQVNSGIKNLAGYFMSALKSNVAAFEKEYVEIMAKRAKTDTKGAALEQASVQEQKANGLKQARLGLRSAKWGAKTPEEQDEIFEEFMEATPLSRSEKQLIRSEGIEASSRLSSLWRIFQDNKLGITDEDVANAVKNQTIIATF